MLPEPIGTEQDIKLTMMHQALRARAEKLQSLRSQLEELVDKVGGEGHAPDVPADTTPAAQHLRSVCDLYARMADQRRALWLRSSARASGRASCRLTSRTSGCAAQNLHRSRLV